MRIQQIGIVTALVLAVVGGAATPLSAALMAADVIQKSEEVYPGQDHTAKLTFTIKEPDGAERKSVLRRFWKNYHGQNGVDFKALVFNEYPPDAKGSSFMLWNYDPHSNKPADRWLYIPILGKVNKLSNTTETGGVAGSDLQPQDMVSRLVEADDHRLVGEDTIGRREYYVVESTPKKADPAYRYSKLVKWITKDTFLKEKIDYYDLRGKLLKRQVITWKPMKDAWVWEKVVITNAQTGVETYLSINDIKTDVGLKDSFFTDRTMKQGADQLP